MAHETGDFQKRPSALLYESWVKLAGGRVRGKKAKPTPVLHAGEMAAPDDPDEDHDEEPCEVAPEYSDIWPLHIIDMKDGKQMALLYRLMAMRPELVKWYLFELVFPLTMEFQARNHRNPPVPLPDAAPESLLRLQPLASTVIKALSKRPGARRGPGVWLPDGLLRHAFRPDAQRTRRVQVRARRRRQDGETNRSCCKLGDKP